MLTSAGEADYPAVRSICVQLSCPRGECCAGEEPDETPTRFVFSIELDVIDRPVGPLQVECPCGAEVPEEQIAEALALALYEEYCSSGGPCTPFALEIRSAAIQALPGIQQAYDRWDGTHPGAGLCGIVANQIEQQLGRANIYCERIGENDHHYVLAISPSGEAVSIDIPWELYEDKIPDPRCSNGPPDWQKREGVSFSTSCLALAQIVGP